MERGLGAVLMPDMQAHIKQLKERTEAVRQAQADLFEKMTEAHGAGMSLRVIGNHVGVNHERVRRALEGEIVTKPF